MPIRLLYFVAFAGWTGLACDMPDCPDGCHEHGVCNGTDREEPECECQAVSLYRIYRLTPQIKF